jgi:hypothetical protein
LNEHSDINVFKLVAGLAGAVVSLRFVQGTWMERTLMAVGGAAMSYLGTTPLAEWLQAPKAEGVIGFFIGLFGMAIVAKIYEVVQLLDAKQIAADVWATIKRKWGA